MNAGLVSIIEPDIQELFVVGHQQQRLSATASASEAIRSTEVSLVCVGTPSQGERQPGSCVHETRVRRNWGRAA